MASDGEQLERLVLFDGVCGLCDKSVQWLLVNDTEARLRFAPLQGETATGVRQRHPEINEIDSIIYVERTDEGEKIYWRSRAIFHIARQLGTAWRGLAVFRFIPAFITDLFYRLVAKVRYRIWGKLTMCRVPTPEERERFLP